MDLQRPDYVPQADWQKLLAITGNDLNASWLIAAIGKQETGWGTLRSDGKDFLLGYGATDSGLLEQYRGMDNQIRAVYGKIRDFFGSNRNFTPQNIADFQNQIYKSTDSAPWITNVSALYRAAVEKSGVQANNSWSDYTARIQAGVSNLPVWTKFLTGQADIKTLLDTPLGNISTSPLPQIGARILAGVFAVLLLILGVFLFSKTGGR